MRKASLIGLATGIAFTMLVGCMRADSKRVEIFDYPVSQRIIVDKETGVLYILFAGKAMSVRLDADGMPMVDGSVK